ncbi:MAG: RNA-guided endonuclease TnpB family protein [Solibacillus sp.]
MAKAKTPSYIVELELCVNPQQRKQLEVKMRVAKQIYNACLAHALKRLKAVLADKTYQLLVQIAYSTERTSRLREIERASGYSEYQLHAYVAPMQRHFKPHIGSLEAQKLATRAFQAVERVHYSQAKRVYFKRATDDMSVENKSNKTGLRFQNHQVIWGTLSLAVRIKKNDVYVHEALADRTKYCRILRREIRGKQRYFVQLIQEGVPPKKRTCKQANDATKRVGLDIGVSTVAISSEPCVDFVELAPNCSVNAKKIRVLQRAVDRSKRAMNPVNFNADGTIKRGVRLEWVQSKRERFLKAKLKEIHRQNAAKRKQAHEQLANFILSLGSDIRVEKMNLRGLQKRAQNTTRHRQNGRINRKKRFGKVISNRAPALFLAILDRKLTYQGLSLKKIDTKSVRASQLNHVTQTYEKKPLSARWNENISGKRIQHDVYSAFLIENTTDDLQAVDLSFCQQRFSSFVQQHDELVQRIAKQSHLGWYFA